MSNKLSLSQKPPRLEPLRLDLKPSRYFSAALIGLALCVVAAIIYSAIDWRVRLACTTMVLVHLAVLLRRHNRSSGYLLWRESGWLWIDCGRDESALELLSATLWPMLIALRFRASNTGKIFTFTLLRDSLDPAMQRRLRTYLRHMPVFAGSNIDADN